MSEKKFYTSDFYNQILFETDNFTVKPSLGSFVEGWLLIVPKKHYISLGSMDDPTLFKELNSLINKIGEIVQKEYGDYVIFENGSLCADKLVGCGVDFAHLHFVPLKLNLIEEIQERFNINYNWEKINDIESSVSYIKSGKPYLYLRNQQNESFITSDDNIPSQLFRKAIAESMSIGEQYDWKQYKFENNIQRTIDKYSKYSGQFN